LPLDRSFKQVAHDYTASADREETNVTNPTLADSGYAPVNGLQMYYEIHGSGRPLVLLHGNLSTIEVDFGRILPALAQFRQVIAVEQQAHGHTADIDRPLSIQNWADDTAALLAHLGIGNADFFGYSSGSAVALQLALQHPRLVRKLGLASFSYRLDGLHPGLLEGIAGLTPEALAGTPFEEAYAKTAPNPDDWPTLISKITRMDQDLPEWSSEDIRSLAAPVLLVIGDSDIVRPEHAVETFRLLGGGVIGDLVGLPRSRLAILPGTTHITLVHRGDWLASMLAEFLDAPEPATA
jgi:pimeloyl-ACP methyl ester carboxylesterase